MDLAAEYNNRAMVPDHPRIIAEWHARAGAYRASSLMEADLSYGAMPRNRVDLFHPPQGPGEGPLVVFMHGGYWRSFDRSGFSHLAAGLNALGVSVAVPSYTLCPAISMPGIIDEIRQCCLFLHRHTGKRLAVSGHSAGGQLAACMAATDWSHFGAPADLIVAGLSISGIFDLRPLMVTPFNDDLRMTPVDAMVASPLFWPVPRILPFDSWVGALESFEFRRQARSLSAAWAGLGLPGRYQEVEGENHFSVIGVLESPDHPMTRRLFELCQT